MAMEKGKERPEWPASREADPRNTEQQAGLSGDNDADRIITQPAAEDGKQETDEAYLKTGAGEGKSDTKEVRGE